MADLSLTRRRALGGLGAIVAGLGVARVPGQLGTEPEQPADPATVRRWLTEAFGAGTADELLEAAAWVAGAPAPCRVVPNAPIRVQDDGDRRSDTLRSFVVAEDGAVDLGPWLSASMGGKSARATVRPGDLVMAWEDRPWEPGRAVVAADAGGYVVRLARVDDDAVVGPVTGFVRPRRLVAFERPYPPILEALWRAPPSRVRPPDEPAASGETEEQTTWRVSA